LVFNEFQVISADSSIVEAEISIENITGTYYVVSPKIVGSVAGPSLPTSDFLIGSLEVKQLGRITFTRGSQLLLFADNSIDISTRRWDLNTQRILTALGGDCVWRIIFGSPFPLSELDKILMIVNLQLDNPLLTVGIDLFKGDILGFINDLPKVIADPEIGPLLQLYGFSGDLGSWFLLYGRAAQVARLLVETLIYPHFGQIVFNAK
jgi:hypothetical protein